MGKTSKSLPHRWLKQMSTLWPNMPAMSIIFQGLGFCQKKLRQWKAFSAVLPKYYKKKNKDFTRAGMEWSWDGWGWTCNTQFHDIYIAVYKKWSPLLSHNVIMTKPGHNLHLPHLPRLRGFHKHPLYFLKAPAFASARDNNSWFLVELLLTSTLWFLCCKNTYIQYEIHIRI